MRSTDITSFDQYSQRFQNALFFAVASKLTESYISNSKNSAFMLLSTVAASLVVLIYVKNTLPVKSKTNELGTITLELAHFLLKIVIDLFVQLQSTLMAHFSVTILNSSASLEWSIVAVVVSASFIWLLLKKGH